MSSRSSQLDLANKSWQIVENLLHQSITSREIQLFKEIVIKRVDAVTTSFVSVPPLIDLLQFVVQEKFLEGLDFLLEFSSDYYLCEENSGVNKARKAFLYATRNNSKDIIVIFLRRIFSAYGGKSSIPSILPLQDVYAHAMIISEYDLARQVVEFDDFNVNAISYVTGEPAIHTAIRFHQHNLVELILDRGSILDQLNRRGNTALRIAASMYDLDTCRLLLANGSSISANLSFGLKSPIYCLFTQAFFSPEAFQTEGQGTAYEICYLLCSAGLEPTLIERWWLDMLIENGYVDADRLPARAAEGFKEPVSLQIQCLRNIREILCRVRNGRGCLRCIDQLPLPLLMKRLLKFELLL